MALLMMGRYAGKMRRLMTVGQLVAKCESLENRQQDRFIRPMFSQCNTPRPSADWSCTCPEITSYTRKGGVAAWQQPHRVEDTAHRVVAGTQQGTQHGERKSWPLLQTIIAPMAGWRAPGKWNKSWWLGADG